MEIRLELGLTQMSSSHSEMVIWLVLWVCASGHLLGLVQLSIHGEKVPEVQFPWALSEERPAGDLTALGEEQQKTHGTALRGNYSQLFGEVYSPHQVFARSIDYPSAVRSLQLQLTSIYPASSSSFSIHTFSDDQETFLLPHLSCLRIPHIMRRDQLLSARHMELMDKITDLEPKLRKYVPALDIWTVNNMSQLVLSYAGRGKKLDFGEDVEKLAALVHDHVHFNLLYGDRQQHKLGMTPLLLDTLQRFHSLLQGESIAPIALYTGSDLSLIPFLRGLDIEEIPGPGAFLTIELWAEETAVLGVKYNGEEVKLQRCGSPCTLEEFEKGYEKRRYDNEELWYTKCNKLNPEKPWPWKRIGLYSFAFGSMLLLIKLKEKLVSRFVQMFKKKAE